MVNLFTIGQAISNVHDGDMVLGSAADVGDVIVLKGIKKPCQFGFMSLFEHYGSIKVGEYLKNPHLPIFIVCSESHFTTMFSTDREILSKTSNKRNGAQSLPSIKAFDLVYYDQLAGQDAEIKLTIQMSTSRYGLEYTIDGGAGRVGGKPVITPNSAASSAPTGKGKKEEDDLIPPLELVLRTRWSECNVDWNGTEPLL
jgi:hypothetical protein